jgi:hypothetical protein
MDAPERPIRDPRSAIRFFSFTVRRPPSAVRRVTSLEFDAFDLPGRRAFTFP